MMQPKTTTCPYCGGAIPEGVTVCPDCQEDLSALAHLEYAHAIHYNEALASAREGKLDDAYAKALVALELNPSFVPAHVLVAKVHAQRDEWPQAKAAIARAQALAPEDESLKRLAGEVARAAREAAVRQEREQRARAQTSEGGVDVRWAGYQRDLMRAFGAGVAVASFLALVVGRLLDSGKDKGNQ